MTVSADNRCITPVDSDISVSKSVLHSNLEFPSLRNTGLRACRRPGGGSQGPGQGAGASRRTTRTDGEGAGRRGPPSGGLRLGAPCLTGVFMTGEKSEVV